MNRKWPIGMVVAGLLVSVAIGFSSTNFSLMFMQQVTVSSGIPEHGAIAIAFDDGNLNQYEYAWPLLEERGLTAVFYVVSDWVRDVSGVSGEMGSAELLEMQSKGCEIGSHSKSHPDFYMLSEQQIRDECLLSKQQLESYGLNIDNFAYPFGSGNVTIDATVSEFYISGRYGWGTMQLPHTDFQVTGFSPYSETGEDLALLKNKVDEVYEIGGWTVIYFHEITLEDKGMTYTSQSDFEQFLDYTLQKGVTVLTVREALALGAEPSEQTVEVKAYSDSKLSNELANGTLIDWHECHIGSNNKALWFENVGTIPITLQFIAETLPSNWSLTWDYQGETLQVDSAMKIVFTLNIGQETVDGTYSFGPIWIDAKKVAD